MSQNERDNFIPQTAVQRQAQTLDREWAAATEQAYDVPLRAARVMEKTGDFAQSAIEGAINEIVETYSAGRQTYNLVTDVIESDCTGKWSMLLETALPAAGKALWLFLVPSPKEILENYLEPKALKSTGRGGSDSKNVRRRKGKSGRIRRFFPRIPDIDKLVADRLPGAQAVQGRQAGRPTRWLFTGINVTDRVLWHWLVLEAGETFFTEWSSGIMESRFCSSPLEFVISGSIIPMPTDNLTTQINDYTNYDIDAEKGRVDAATWLVSYDTQVIGTVAFGFTLTYDEPVKTVYANQVGVLFYRNGIYLGSKYFDISVQEGDTSVEFGGEAEWPNWDQAQITMGNFYTQPFPTFIAGGSVMSVAEKWNP